MKMFKWMWALLTALSLVACGGGVGPDSTAPFGSANGSASGSSSGTGSGSGSGTGTSTASPTLSVSISSTNVTPTVPATVTVTLKDAQGQALAGKVVSLSTTGELGTFAVGSVLTDSTGSATAVLQAAAKGTAGADEVVARAVLDSATTVQGSIPFQVTIAAATVSASLSSTTVSASAPVTFTAIVRDAQGAPVAGQLVQFASSNSLIGLSAASAVTNAAGSASVIVTVANAATNGATQVTASATVNSASILGQALVSVSGEVPSVKLTLSSTTVTSAGPVTVHATVLDSKGNPVDAGLVTFGSSLGMGAFNNTTAMTDKFGIATAVLSPKTASTSGADFITAQSTVNTVTASDRLVAQFTPSVGSATGFSTLTLALSSTSVSSASPATVTATVLDSNGQAVPGKVVAFTTLRSLGALSVGTALTNTSGQAVVALAPASSTAAGADEVIASTTVAGNSLQSTQGFQIQASTVTLSGFTSSVGAGTLSAYGQASLTVTVAGASVGSPVNVALSSSCVTAGKASMSPATFTATTPTTSIQYKDNGCGALQSSDQLQAAIVGSSAAPVLLNMAIAGPSVSSLSFVTATPSVIFLKGSGLGEVSNVTFELRDFAGNPLPNRDIGLSLVTSVGGVTIEGGPGPVTQKTNSLGQVTVRINSGTVPTSVRVVAKEVSTGIETVSSSLSVAVGLPSQLNFSLSQTTLNIEGFNLDGTTNTYTIIASDRSGNPVPNGTSINFVTESGQIEAIKQTQTVQGISRTNANFVSSSPRPADGRFTVTVYALGEESFLDLNGNNVYDVGEPFQDLGDVFRDRNYDGQYDAALDEFISLNIAGTTDCVPPSNFGPTAAALLGFDVSIPNIVSTNQVAVPFKKTCDGVWGRAYVRRAVETVLSTSGSDPVWIPGTEPASAGSAIALATGPNSVPITFHRVSGSSITGAGALGTLTFIVRDQNPVRLNPMAATSIITATATTGLTVTVAGSPVPNTTDASLASITYEFGATVASGTITVTIRSPSGAGTVFQIPVVK